MSKAARGILYAIPAAVILWLIITAIVWALTIDWQQDCQSGYYDAVVNGDGSATITCYLAESTATPEPTMTATAEPTETPTNTPEPTATPTPTATPSPSGNLLLNPTFYNQVGEVCDTTARFTAPGWQDDHFLFTGVWDDSLTNGCAARAKGSNYNGGAYNLIQPGQSGRLWQIVAVPAFVTLVFDDIYSQHESGTIIHRIYGCADAAGAGCALIVATNPATMRVPAVKSKTTCDMYRQRLTVDTAGNARYEVFQAAPGCANPLPALIDFTVSSFTAPAYIKAEVEVDPLDNGSGQSGYKSDSWSLEALD